MQTSLLESIRQTPTGMEAEQILRSCVHCGFCNATCPTYQLLNDELDGPRGRIYLIKSMLEGNAPTASTQLHLDRCLTCRACETTCPSGVKYGRLLDIGRSLSHQQTTRSLTERLTRKALRLVLPFPHRFGLLLGIGQLFRPLLPGVLKKQIPLKQKPGQQKQGQQKSASTTVKNHGRKMLLLQGCVQPDLRPQIDAAAVRILDRLGIELTTVDQSGCCGAVSHHLDASEEAKEFMRRNIDAWWPHLENGAEAIVITASGCAVMVKEYAHLLRDDQSYCAKAQVISERVRDISEILSSEDLSPLKPAGNSQEPIAFQSPCTLQHGMKLAGKVETILTELGFKLTKVPDSHLCCGSAGTYSILQGKLSRQLRDNKLSALQSGQPARIVTANIGCLTHLATRADVPVQHWIELLDPAKQ